MSLVALLIPWFGSAEDLDRRVITFSSLEVVFGNWATTLRMLPLCGLSLDEMDKQLGIQKDPLDDERQ